jgi:hypothetical protein
MEDKIIVGHYEIIVTIPKDSSHRDVIEAWLSSSMFHEQFENILIEQHSDIAAETDIDVTNNVVVCPRCSGQHEMDEVFEMDEESELETV